MARTQHVEQAETVLEIVKNLPGINDPNSDEVWNLRKQKQDCSHGVFKAGNEWQISGKLYLEDAGYENWTYPDLLYNKDQYLPQNVEQELMGLNDNQNVYEGIFYKVTVGKRSRIKYGDGNKSYQYQWDIIRWGERTQAPVKATKRPFEPSYPKQEQEWASPVVNAAVSHGAQVTRQTTIPPKETIIDKGYDEGRPMGNKDTLIESGEWEQQPQLTEKEKTDRKITFLALAKVAADCVSAKAEDYPTADAMFDHVCEMSVSKLEQIYNLDKYKAQLDRAIQEEEQTQKQMEQFQQ